MRSERGKTRRATERIILSVALRLTRSGTRIRGAARGRPRGCCVGRGLRSGLELGAAGALAVLVPAALGGLRLGLAGLAGLLVETLAAHVPEHSRPQHAAAELLQRPIQ